MLESVLAAPDRRLLTIDELRRAAGVTDSASDVALEEAGMRAAAAIARACNVAQAGGAIPTLRLETLRETQRLSRPAAVLMLARRFIKDVASITVDGEAMAPAEFEAVGGGMVFALRNDRHINWPVGKIVVEYRAGLETVPDDLKLAASILARDLFLSAGRDPSLKRDRIEGVGEREYWISANEDPAIPFEVAELITPYFTPRGF